MKISQYSFGTSFGLSTVPFLLLPYRALYLKRSDARSYRSTSAALVMCHVFPGVVLSAAALHRYSLVLATTGAFAFFQPTKEQSFCNILIHHAAYIPSTPKL